MKTITADIVLNMYTYIYIHGEKTNYSKKTMQYVPFFPSFPGKFYPFFPMVLSAPIVFYVIYIVICSMLYCIIPYHTIPNHIMSYHFISGRIILCYTLL